MLDSGRKIFWPAKAEEREREIAFHFRECNLNSAAPQNSYLLERGLSLQRTVDRCAGSTIVFGIVR
jgi:hypothetical protein